MKIEVGCGRKPAIGYDVYTDVYESEQIKNNLWVKSRFVKTPAEDMSMFKDKQFDYLRCHHVIEHVNDPNKACSEFVRIAKKGILWFPTVEAEILFGRNDHNWMVFQLTTGKAKSPNHLLFIKKRFKSFYGHNRRNLPKEAQSFIGLAQEPFEWEEGFTWTVVL